MSRSDVYGYDLGRSPDPHNKAAEPEQPNLFGPKRLSPHADFINSKHRLDYAITDLVKEFCEHHDLQADHIEIVVASAGCYAKVYI